VLSCPRRQPIAPANSSNACSITQETATVSGSAASGYTATFTINAAA
jgi:hypothetical protein